MRYSLFLILFRLVESMYVNHVINCGIFAFIVEL